MSKLTERVFVLVFVFVLSLSLFLSLFLSLSVFGEDLGKGLTSDPWANTRLSRFAPRRRDSSIVKPVKVGLECIVNTLTSSQAR